MTSESQIEESFIQKLVDLKYVYRKDITTQATIEQNFRQKFNALNRVNLSDNEFDKLKRTIIKSDVFEASNFLRKRHSMTRDDGTPLPYTLVNTTAWCKNDFEVVSQLRLDTQSSYHRYDVILLINGIPVVQVELKRYDISPRKAMQQIVAYKNDEGNGYNKTLFCFMQLFIVSSGHKTYYFSNNIDKHFAFDANEQFLPIYQLAKDDNSKIHNLYDFAEAFLGKCALGQMISRYMVLVANERKIMVMRPYQIYAVKAIVDCIEQNRGNGYIWHTTGSGKTLTSFKAATLLKENPKIEKCFFVVDRKDLDYQTRLEFNKFQEGCVDENSTTGELVEKMHSRDYANKVIVTTIQKLGAALDEESVTNKKRKNRGKDSYTEELKHLSDKRVVFIFDECHRSQFGKYHQSIKDFFPHAQLFGFTGTPIWSENATYRKIDGTSATLKTTEEVFEKQLHAYTIADAIADESVLPFKVDYFEPEAAAEPATAAYQQSVVRSILQKHHRSTQDRRFNALFATGSINEAIAYYEAFKAIQAQLAEEEESYTALNIACVFSPPGTVSKRARQIQDDLEQERIDNKVEPALKKAALEAIINEYNQQYGSNHTIQEFDNYYTDVQQRIKAQQYPNKDWPAHKKIDITIVVDMLLTGFDSKYLNTLYTDKNLKYHGLIQAFSRTNRTLNHNKKQGNILDFRGLEEKVKDAITLFSDKSEREPQKIWLVESAPVVIADYQEAVEDLEAFMAEEGLECLPEQIPNLKGNAAKATFVELFKKIQRLKNKLDQYTALSEVQETQIEDLLPKDNFRAFRVEYLEVARQLEYLQNNDPQNLPQDIQQLEFDFVLFHSVTIDYDYIMKLIAEYTQPDTKMSREQIVTLIKSVANMMDEQDDIIAYVDTLEVGSQQTKAEIIAGYEQFKAELNQQNLNLIAQKHELDPQHLHDFVAEIMRRMIFDGQDLSDLFEPLQLRWKARVQREIALMEDLIPLLKKRAQGREIAGLKAYE